jgi:hypothetical protein
MDASSASLLERRKRARPGAPEWRRLQEIYLSLVRSWPARGIAGATARYLMPGKARAGSS